MTDPGWTMPVLGERAQRGLSLYARNVGVDEAAAARMMSERAGVDYAVEAWEAAGGPGWHGDSLTDRDRSIAVIAAFVAGGVTDERLDVYLGVARRNGVDEAGLAQLMILLTAYVGQPRSSAAMQAVRRSAARPDDPWGQAANRAGDAGG